MNRYRAAVLPAWLALQIFTPGVQASDWSGAVTLTSEYIYRGLKMSDGNPALQLGIDYEHDSGLFAGVWASTVDLSTPIGRRDTELDYYAGFHFAPEGPWSAMLTLLHYTYAGQVGPHRYDHSEVLVSAAFRERYSLELGYTNDLNGLDRIGRHWELRAEWPVANSLLIGAGLGGNDLSDAGVSSYLYWDIGASARITYLNLDLRWYGSEQADGFAARSSARSQLVLSLSVAF